MAVNPFAFDKIAVGNNFCNREHEIQELLSDVRASHNIVMFSQRRYGKTSLITKVLDLAEDEGLLTIYMDIFHILNENDFIRTYAKALASQIEGPIEKTLQTLRSIFSSLRPKVTVAADGKPEFLFGIEAGQEQETDLKEALEAVHKYSKKRNKNAVVVIDEFQQIGQLNQAHRIESLIRAQIQGHQNISYILMGSKKHLIFDLFNDPTRPLYGIGKMFPLNKIAPEHLAGFIYKRFQETQKTLTIELASQIVEQCESHPYYTQYVCHSLWEIAPNNTSIKEADLKIAVDLTISRISPKYESTWELLPAGQKQALIALAQIGRNEKIFSSDVISKYNLTSPPSFRKALKSLFDKSLVDREKGRFSIIDIFFKKWIQLYFIQK